jgi:hypothetical protein
MRGLDKPLRVILNASNSLFLLNLINMIESLTRDRGLVGLYRQTGLTNPFFKWSLLDFMAMHSEANPTLGSKIFLSPVGQLSTKMEAAGKIRVFAMVDVWTQSALKPLHLYLFSFLKSLPNDGTFDQHASVLRCMQKSAVSGCSYGYDLSAATDRLPIALQVSVLTAFFDAAFAEAWRQLLVDRIYILKDIDKKGVFHALKYSVGQPMGALSS